MRYHWPFWARNDQVEPSGDWFIWLFQGGRGTGKTRTGAEWIKQRVVNDPIVHFIARTKADYRDVMVNGESGIRSVYPKDQRPQWIASRRMVRFHNGAVALCFSADEPDSTRGPQCYSLWADEVASWRHGRETWDNAMMGVRLGFKPRVCVTTTPKNNKLTHEIVNHKSVTITHGTTFDNRDFLAPSFFDNIVARYSGTRYGDQEIGGVLHTDNPRALWRADRIDECRVGKPPSRMVRVVVAVDPGPQSHIGAAETGIVVGCIDENGKGYVLEDASILARPEIWGAEVVRVYKRWGADMIVGEGNNGGEMIETVIRSVDGGKDVNYAMIWATRGKETRAEPIASLSNQGRISHVGTFPDLEDELTQWVPGEFSPNRLDAMVWCFTDLMLGDDQISYPAPAAYDRTSLWTPRGYVRDEYDDRDY